MVTKPCHIDLWLDVALQQPIIKVDCYRRPTQWRYRVGTTRVILTVVEQTKKAGVHPSHDKDEIARGAIFPRVHVLYNDEKLPRNQ